MKAVGYVRVSTEKQADFGVSLEAQSEKVRAIPSRTWRDTAISPLRGGMFTHKLTRYGKRWSGRGRRGVGTILGTVTKSQWNQPTSEARITE